MVVSGIPDPLNTHAERIANTGLGMLLSAAEVMSPFDYGDGNKTVKVKGKYCQDSHEIKLNKFTKHI